MWLLSFLASPLFHLIYASSANSARRDEKQQQEQQEQEKQNSELHPVTIAVNDNEEQTDDGLVVAKSEQTTATTIAETATKESLQQEQQQQQQQNQKNVNGDVNNTARDDESFLTKTVHQTSQTSGESDHLHRQRSHHMTPFATTKVMKKHHRLPLYEASAGIIWMHGQNAPISHDTPGGELPYLYEQCNVVSTLIKNRNQL
mgnify:CR=1 FL=1